MSIASQQQIQVLHVDDEPDFADLTGTFLEREDDRFAVETATSADEGLQRITDRPPDCVVSDYDMPGMDGIEFLRAVRKEYPDLPFVLFTGKGSEEVASDALRAGATDYIQKQSGSEQYELLANRIDNAVTQHRSEERLRETRKEYTAVFENAQNALILVQVEDDGFRYQQCNPQAVELIGRDEAEIVGNTPQETLGLENGTKVVGAYRTCIERREPVAYTVTLDLPMGEVIRECEVAPVSSEGEIEQLVVEFRDVTEQRERQQELEEYGTIIEALTDAVYVLDEEGRFTYVNDEFLELVGYDRDTILGSLPSLIKDEAAVERAEQQLGRLLSSDGPDTVAFEVTIHARDGDRIVCEDHMGVLPYEGDRFNGSVGTLRDITDRKERERELAQTHDLVTNMEQLADVGAWEYDSDAETLVMTDGAHRIHGLDPDADLTLEEAFDNFHPDDRDVLADRFDECLETGTPYEIDVRLTTSGGEQRWVTARGERITDSGDGSVVRGYIQDITGRKEREQKLDLVETLFEYTEECQFIVDVADGEFELRHANQYYKRTVGLPANTPVTGETPVELFGETGGQQVLDRYRRCVETQDSVSYTVELPVPEEGTVYRTILTPVTTDGEVTHIVGTARDITDRIDRQQELERQNERLEEFASIVSHDLRNPLRVADGRLELIRNECESPHTDDVAQALDRMNALIEDLLTLAREGHRADETESVELATVATNSWQTVDTAQATLETDTTRAVEADRSRLQQLLENLYRNAVEHGGDDVTVSVGAMGDGFYVADTGPGIPESDRQEVFEAGYSTNEEGTGFGLRIVEQIADAHGWDVTVTESEQGGARFEVTGVEFADQ